MPDEKRMVCEECGVAMNHHADKLVYEDGGAEGAGELGGLVEEAHACPACGKTAVRREGEAR